MHLTVDVIHTTKASGSTPVRRKEIDEGGFLFIALDRPVVALAVFF